MMMMQQSVLLVVGKVHDRYLDYGKCAFLEDGHIAKTVRISQADFQEGFCNYLGERNIGNLAGIASLMARQGRPVLSAHRAIESCGGRVGGVMLDQPSWRLSHWDGDLFTGVPTWMVAKDGRIGLLPD